MERSGRFAGQSARELNTTKKKRMTSKSIRLISHPLFVIVLSHPHRIILTIEQKSAFCSEINDSCSILNKTDIFVQRIGKRRPALPGDQVFSASNYLKRAFTKAGTSATFFQKQAIILSRLRKADGTSRHCRQKPVKIPRPPR